MSRRTEVFFIELITLTIFFILHRVLSFDLLSIELLPGADAALKSMLIGAISDFWMATVVALVLLIIRKIFDCFRSKVDSTNHSPVALTVAMGLLLVLHQSYVEFFRYTIVPSHFAYLWDRQFLAANSSSALSPRSILLALLLMITAWIMERISLEFRRGRRFRVMLVAVTVLISILLHSFQVNYRRRWLIPDRLQCNLFEKLYYNLAISIDPPDFSDGDWRVLAGLFADSSAESLQSRDLGLMMRPVHAVVEDRFAESLKSHFRTAIGERRSPMILVVLMESMRPSETGLHNPEGRSVTPIFDRLAANGISFMNAYATGTVTRAGQEAVFCGYLSGQNTSMMRNRPDVQFRCLPEILSRSGFAPFSFWFHGGDGEFDNQQSFWLRQKVAKTLARKDFDASVPSTSWGVGDVSLIRRSVQEIIAARSAGFHYALGMILTVTNHIPWKLPEDAPAHLGDSELLDRHPSYRTTAYADFALGQLVDGMKASGLWRDAVVMVASDHGVLMDPLNEPNIAADVRGAELYGHIVLALTGGLVESSIQMSGVSAHDRKRFEFVSQADLAPLIAYLTGENDARFLGEQLFLKQRRSPVITDLGHSVYIPALRKILTREELTSLNNAAIDPAIHSGMIYYRGFLHMLNGRQPKL